MDFQGHINLNNNELQQAVVQTEQNFPANPTAGRLVFKDRRVYMCVEVSGGVPAWVPLTNEINTYVHTQETATSVWTVTHNLNTTSPMIQLYDTTNTMFFPQSIDIVSNNQVTITLGTDSAGRAVVMYGSITGNDRATYSYTHHQTNTATTWTINHNLGYHPIVRVFVGANEEIQPQTVIHDTLYTTTITFSQTYTGIARLI